MPFGPTEVDSDEVSISPSALPKRLAMLKSLSEKREFMKNQDSLSLRKTIRRVVPSMQVKPPSQDGDCESSRPAGVGYHLSPKTLRRLEHKHQVAKLQQDKRTFDLSPPVSPQTYRKLILTRGGANSRRFTVARTR